MGRKLFALVDPDGRTVLCLAFRVNDCKDEVSSSYMNPGDSYELGWERAKAVGYLVKEVGLTKPSMAFYDIDSDMVDPWELLEDAD